MKKALTCLACMAIMAASLTFMSAASAQQHPEFMHLKAEVEQLREKVRMDKGRVEEAQAELRADRERLRATEERLKRFRMERHEHHKERPRGPGAPPLSGPGPY